MWVYELTRPDQRRFLFRAPSDAQREAERHAGHKIIWVEASHNLTHGTGRDDEYEIRRRMVN